MRSRLPLLVVGLAALGAAFVVLPVLALFVRAPWGQLGDAFRGVGASTALRLSLQVSLAATAISLLIGVPLAWVLARGTFPGRRVLRALVVLPIVLPPVVGGMAVLVALGRGGIVGRWLYAAFGVQLTFTTVGAVIATTFVSMPLVVLATDSGLRGLDRRYERAAAAMGGSAWYVFRRVTLPMVGPQVAAGAVLTWARALGEFGATITFAGNFPGKTQTLPLAIYLAFENNDPAGIILSILLLTVSVAVLVVVGSRVFSDRLRLREAAG
jgi:molybdate transport system permease protein